MSNDLKADVSGAGEALALELVACLGGHAAFDVLVDELVATWYQSLPTRRVPPTHGVANEPAAFPAKVEAFESHLRAQYPAYVRTLADMYTERLSADELGEICEALRDERVGRSMAALGALKKDEAFRLKTFRDEIVREALLAAGLAPKIRTNTLIEVSRTEPR